jgi:hypothetical protein
MESTLGERKRFVDGDRVRITGVPGLEGKVAIVRGISFDSFITFYIVETEGRRFRYGRGGSHSELDEYWNCASLPGSNLVDY